TPTATPRASIRRSPPTMRRPPRRSNSMTRPNPPSARKTPVPPTTWRRTRAPACAHPRRRAAHADEVMSRRAGEAAASPIEDEFARAALVLEHPPRTHRLWARARRWLGVAFALGGAALLLAHLGAVDWAATLAALRERPAGTLWGAAGLTL